MARSVWVSQGIASTAPPPHVPRPRANRSRAIRSACGPRSAAAGLLRRARSAGLEGPEPRHRVRPGAIRGAGRDARASPPSLEWPWRRTPCTGARAPSWPSTSPLGCRSSRPMTTPRATACWRGCWPPTPSRRGRTGRGASRGASPTASTRRPPGRSSRPRPRTTSRCSARTSREAARQPTGSSPRAVPWATHVVRHRLAHDRRRRARMVFERGRTTPHRGRWLDAETHLRSLGPLADGLHRWEARMATGVMHQIRIHARLRPRPRRRPALWRGRCRRDPRPFRPAPPRLRGPASTRPPAPPTGGRRRDPRPRTSAGWRRRWE